MSHVHKGQHSHLGSGTKDLKVIFFLNLTFAFIELAGGILTNSIAIISDAIHDFGDATAIGSAWYFEKLGRKGRDARHTYGYRRYTIVGAIINAIVLVAGSIFVVQEAISRLASPQEVHADGMIGLAMLGLLVNGFAFKYMHAGQSVNKGVLRLHLLEDVLGWLVVLIGALVIKFTGWYLLDPILSIGIAVFILWNAVKRLRQSLAILVQGVPPSIDVDDLASHIKAFDFVEDVHDTHVWSLDGERHIMTTHIVLDRSYPLADLALFKDRLRKVLESLGIGHLTVEFETSDEDCELDDC